MFKERLEEETKGLPADERAARAADIAASVVVGAFDAARGDRGLAVAAKAQERLFDPAALHAEPTISTFSRGRDRLDIKSVTQEGNGAVKVWAVAASRGKELSLDLPIYIINPPLLVEDPDGDIEIEVDGTILHFREDPIGAVSEAILDVVGGNR